jgi:hypothetical protein
MKILFWVIINIICLGFIFLIFKILIDYFIWIFKTIVGFFSSKDNIITNNNIVSEPEPKQYLPYTKKWHFLTKNERHFLDVIEQVTNNRYYIFPQVHYSKIIYADGQQNFKNPFFNKINSKSADFVLFDRVDVSPVLVIEVDDSSHYRQDRIDRDDFINDVLETCGIPVVHVHPFVNDEELRKEILEKIII